MFRPTLTVLVLLFAASCGKPVKGDEGPRGEAGPAGPQGDKGDGFTAPPSVSTVTPSRVAASLTVDVAISGFATSWSQSAVVNFGAGVTVNSVKVGSRTGLIANITVAADAMPGTREVRVMQGNELTTFTGVFTIVPLLEVKAIGAASQGGYWFFEVKSNDPDFSFPAVRDDVRVTVTPVATAGEVTGDLSLLKPRNLVVRLHASLAATRQMYTTTLDYDGKTLTLPAFELGEAMPLLLSEQTPVSGMLMPFESRLVKYVSPATSVLHVSGPQGARWQLTLLDADGDPRSTTGSMGAPAPGNDLVIPGDTVGTYVLLTEVEGRTSPFTLTALDGINPLFESEPNETAAEAQLLTLGMLGPDPGVRVTGNSSSYYEDDWFKVSVAEADLGKRLHVRSYNLEYIYFNVEVTSPDGDVIADSDVSNITVDLYSPVLTKAGDYLIYFSGDDTGDHDLIIGLQ